MTNGIRASDFSDMPSNISVDFPFNPYSSNPFQNPSFYYPYQYTPPLTLTPPIHQYAPPPTPPHVYHHIQQPQPPYQFYTGPQTPYIFTTPMLISDITKGFLHQLDSKVNQLDEKLLEISTLIEKKKRVAYLPNLVQVNVSQESPADCEGRTQYHNSMEVAVNEQWEDKRNQIIQMFDKMEKRFANSSNPVKEMFSNKVVQSPYKLSHVSIVDSLDDLCRVEKTIDDNSEDLKQFQVLTPAKYAPEVFDSILETDFIVSAVESSERAMNRDFLYHFTGFEMILNSKFHENEYGKYQMKRRDKEMVQMDKGRYNENKRSSTFQLVEPELYQAYKGIVQRLIKTDDKVSWKMIVLGLVIKSSNITGCELFKNKFCRNLVAWDGVDQIKCYKLHEDEYGKNLAKNSQDVYDSEFLHKGTRLNVPLECSCDDDSLCKSVCLNSMCGQFDKAPRKELVNSNVFISYAIKEFMFEGLFSQFCYKSQNDVSRVDCFTTPTMLVPYFGYLVLVKGREVRACSPQYGSLIKLTIAIKVVLGSEECTASVLVKAYSGSGQVEYATSFYKKVLAGLLDEGRRCSANAIQSPGPKINCYNMVEGTATELKWKGLVEDMIRKDKLVNCIVVFDELECRTGILVRFLVVMSEDPWTWSIESYFCSSKWDVKNLVDHVHVLQDKRMISIKTLTLLVSSLYDNNFHGKQVCHFGVKGRQYDQAIRSFGPKLNGSKMVVGWGDEMRPLTRGMASFVPRVQLQCEKEDWLKESRKGIYSESVYLVRIHVVEQAIEESYSIRNKKLGHVLERMQKFGEQLLVAGSSYFDILWSLRKADLMVIEVYNLPNVMYKISEAVKNSFHLGVELDGPYCTLYSVLRQSSPEVDNDFLNRKELCKIIHFDRAIPYSDVFQTADSSCEVCEVQELLMLYVTPLPLDTGRRKVVIVFILTNTTLPAKNNQVLLNYYDDEPDVIVLVFKCERTGMKDHSLLCLFELSGSLFIAKKIAPSWYW